METSLGNMIRPQKKYCLVIVFLTLTLTLTPLFCNRCSLFAVYLGSLALQGTRHVLYPRSSIYSILPPMLSCCCCGSSPSLSKTSVPRSVGRNAPLILSTSGRYSASCLLNAVKHVDLPDIHGNVEPSLCCSYFLRISETRLYGMWKSSVGA